MENNFQHIQKRRPPTHQKRLRDASSNNDLADVHLASRKPNHSNAFKLPVSNKASHSANRGGHVDDKETMKREIIAQDFLTKNIYVNPLSLKSGAIDLQTNSYEDYELQMLQLKSAEYLPPHQLDESNLRRLAMANTTSHETLQQRSKQFGKGFKWQASQQLKALRSATNGTKTGYGAAISVMDQVRSDSSMDAPGLRSQAFKHLKQDERRQTTNDSDAKPFGKENMFGNQQMQDRGGSYNIKPRQMATKAKMQKKVFLRELGRDQQALGENELKYAQKLKDLSRMGADLKRLKQDTRNSRISNFRLKSNGPLTVQDLQERERELKLAIESDPELAKQPRIQKELARINKGLGRQQKKKREEDADSFDEHEIMRNMMQQPEFAGVQVPEEMLKNKQSKQTKSLKRQASNVSHKIEEDSEQEALDENRREARRRMNEKLPKRTTPTLMNQPSVGAQQGMQKSAYKLPAAAQTSTGFALTHELKDADSSQLHQMNKTQNGINSMKNLTKLTHGLKVCKGESGIFNPTKAFDCLNNIQKEQDPDAYESEVVKTINAQKARIEFMKQKKREATELKKAEAQQIDKALFDFDEEIDNLEQVEDRYPVAPGVAEQFESREALVTEDDRRGQTEQTTEKKQVEVQKPKPVSLVKRPQRPAGLSDNVIKDIERVKAQMKNKQGDGKGSNAASTVKIDYKPPPALVQQEAKKEQQEDSLPTNEEIRLMRLKKLKNHTSPDQVQQHAAHPSMSDIPQTGGSGVTSAFQQQDITAKPAAPGTGLEMIGEVEESKYQTAKFNTNNDKTTAAMEVKQNEQPVKFLKRHSVEQIQEGRRRRLEAEKRSNSTNKLSEENDAVSPVRQTSANRKNNQQQQPKDKMIRSDKVQFQKRKMSRESSNTEILNSDYEQGRVRGAGVNKTSGQLMVQRKLNSLSPATLSNTSEHPISLKERAKKLRTIDANESRQSNKCIGIIYGVDKNCTSPPLMIKDQEENVFSNSRNSQVQQSMGSRKKRGRILPKFDRETHPLNAWQRQKEIDKNMRSSKNLHQLEQEGQQPYEDQVVKQYADAQLARNNSAKSSQMKNVHVHTGGASASSQSRDYRISPSPDVTDKANKQRIRPTAIDRQNMASSALPQLTNRTKDKMRPYQDAAGRKDEGSANEEAEAVRRQESSQRHTERDRKGSPAPRSKEDARQEEFTRMHDIYTAPLPKAIKSNRTGALVSRAGARAHQQSGKLETASSLGSSLEKRSHKSRLQRYVDNIDKQSAEIRHTLSRSSQKSLTLKKENGGDALFAQKVDAPYKEISPMLVMETDEKPLPTLPPAPRNPRLDYHRQQVGRTRVANTGHGVRPHHQQQPLYLYKRKMQQTRVGGLEGLQGTTANLMLTHDHVNVAQSSAQSSSVVFSGGARESSQKWTSSGQRERLSLSRDAFSRRNPSGSGPASVSETTRRTQTTRGMLDLHQKLQVVTKKYRAEKQAKLSYHQRHLEQQSTDPTPSNSTRLKRHAANDDGFNRRVSAFITERTQPQRGARRYEAGNDGQQQLQVRVNNKPEQPPLERRVVGASLLESLKEQNTASLLYSGGNASDGDELDIHDVLAANDDLPPRHLLTRNSSKKAQAATLVQPAPSAFAEYGGRDKPPLAAATKTMAHSRRISSMLMTHQPTTRDVARAPPGATSSLSRPPADSRQGWKHSTVASAKTLQQKKKRLMSCHTNTRKSMQARHQMFV